MTGCSHMVSVQLNTWPGLSTYQVLNSCLVYLEQIDLTEPIPLKIKTTADVLQIEGLLWSEIHNQWFHQGNPLPQLLKKPSIQYAMSSWHWPHSYGSSLFLCAIWPLTRKEHSSALWYILFLILVVSSHPLHQKFW